MEKALNNDSDFGEKEHDESYLPEHWISHLPDDLLTLILSCLTMREAAKASLVSRRWHEHWLYFSGKFHFDDPESMSRLDNEGNRELLIELRSRFEGFVTGVLAAHRGPAMEEFVVRFDLRKGSSRVIDEWLKVVLSKRTKKIEFDMLLSMADDGDRDDYKPPDVYADLNLNPQNISCFNCLTTVSFTWVNVSGYFLEHLLLNCPLLESLSVHLAEDLDCVKAASPLPSLKYLDICECRFMKKIEICAPKLSKFRYYGVEPELNLEHCTQLSDVTVGGNYAVPLHFAFKLVSRLVSQLTTLSLYITPIGCAAFEMPVSCFPKMENLRQLWFHARVIAYDRICNWLHLLEACPSLQDLTVMFMVSRTSEREVVKTSLPPHQCLKTIEIVGFEGHPVDLEFSLNLIDAAPMLNKLIIDLRSPPVLGERYDNKTDEEKNVIQQHAMKLKDRLSTDVEFIIM